jgi:formate dehydrogenase subunit gamma
MIPTDRVTRRLKGIGLLSIFLLMLCSTGAALAQEQRAMAQRPVAAPPGSGEIAADYWRNLRQGEAGYSASAPGNESNLINPSGTTWQAQRNEEMFQAGAWAFAIFAGAVALFYLMRGTIRLDKGRSGKVVERWPLMHRVVHWWVAILFLVQLVTGVLLLYGKPLLIPLIGKEAFGTLALLSKNAHNYLGPLLFIGMLVMVIIWVKDNLFTKTDLKWFASGGGLIGKGHPHAGFLNGGEKIWFWLVVLVGGLVAVTGMVLDFPQFGQSRDTMQFMHYLHGIAGLIIGAATIGHIYIATIGTEGALEGIVNGHVDTNWAAQHHDLWYETVKDQAVDAAEVQSGAGGGSPQPDEAPNSSPA